MGKELFTRASPGLVSLLRLHFFHSCRTSAAGQAFGGQSCINHTQGGDLKPRYLLLQVTNIFDTNAIFDLLDHGFCEALKEKICMTFAKSVFLVCL